MLKASVSYLPVWKAGATAEERFLELAAIAREHPERFAHVIVGYNEKLDDGMFVTRYITQGEGGTLFFLGLLEMVKEKLMRWSLDNDG